MITLANARVGDAIVDVVLVDGHIASIIPSGRNSAVGEQIDLDGRWLLPGLWDHHVHANQQALAVRRIDLSTATSAAEAAHTMADNLSRLRLASGHPIIGHGFRDGLWPDAPTVDGLSFTIPHPELAGQKALTFAHRLEAPAKSIDQRVKFPALMQVFADRGGELIYADAGIDELEKYAAASDLVLVAAGKGEIAQLFSRDDERSIYDVAQTREEAICTMERALNEYIIEGIKTTIPFHQQLMRNEAFRKGDFTTKFIETFELL